MLGEDCVYKCWSYDEKFVFYVVFGVSNYEFVICVGVLFEEIFGQIFSCLGVDFVKFSVFEEYCVLLFGFRFFWSFFVWVVVYVVVKR